METIMNAKRAFAPRLALAIAILAVITLSCVTHVRANECDGNACGAISMTWTGSCYEVANNSQRNVKVDVKPYGGAATNISKVLKPGEKWTVTSYPTGACLKGYVQPYHAFFQ